MPVMGEADFSCLAVEGLGPRMQAIRSRISPKLEEIGAEMAPWLSEKTGHAFFAHVAKHARRTVNPPDDTWVALSEAARGYKMMPHAEIGLFASCLFVRLGVLPEAREKDRFSRAAQEHLGDLPGWVQVFFDHRRPEAKALADRADPGAQIRAHLRGRQGEVFLGRIWPAEQVMGKDVVPVAKEALEPLLSLYIRAVEEAPPKV